MKGRYNRILLQLLLSLSTSLLLCNASAASGELTVTSEQWSRISSPGEFMAIGGLGALVTEFNQQAASTINIHYQGGENGLLWAQQFRNRLVALGVESRRIQLVQGVPHDNTLVIELQEQQ